MAVGDRFAIMLRNHPEFIECMIAASILGAVFVPIDPRTRGEKLGYMLRNSGATGVICADTCLAELAGVRDDLPELRFVLVVATGEETPASRDVDGSEPLAEMLAKPAETVDLRGDGLLAMPPGSRGGQVHTYRHRVHHLSQGRSGPRHIPRPHRARVD